MNQGVVSKIHSKDFPNGTAYSFTLSGDRTFYRLGNTPPSFKEGDSVRFETAQKGQNTYARNVVLWKEDGVTSSKPASEIARSSSGPKTSDEFWRNKEQRDVLVQSRIELQSCRNSAIELVRLLLQPGVEAVKLPAAQAKREAILVEMVRKYTSDFLKENKAGGPQVDGGEEPAIDKAAEEAAPIAEPSNDDNWN
jgi:hypothetical protein